MASLWFEDGAAGDNLRGADQSVDARDPPPFPIVEYIEWYGDRLDGQKLSTMGLAGNIR